MKAAPGTGIISSAVLMSDDFDEIDWEFSGNNFAAGHGAVQTNYFGKGITDGYDRGTLPQIQDPTADFHTYTYDWSESQLQWIVDGQPIRTLLAANQDTSSHQYPQTPSRLHLGLWDGGGSQQPGGTVFWAGGYTDVSQAPFTMYVKSVHIHNANPGPYYNWTDKTGSSKSIKIVNSTGIVGSSSSSGVPGFVAGSSTSKSLSKTLGPNDFSGITAPTPTQNSVVSNCNAWYKVSSGDGCYTISLNHGVSLQDFYRWNPDVGIDCGNLWINYYQCVGVGPNSTEPSSSGVTSAASDPASASATSKMTWSDLNYHPAVSGSDTAAAATAAALGTSSASSLASKGASAGGETSKDSSSTVKTLETSASLAVATTVIMDPTSSVTSQKTVTSTVVPGPSHPSLMSSATNDTSCSNSNSSVKAQDASGSQATLSTRSALTITSSDVLTATMSSGSSSSNESLSGQEPILGAGTGTSSSAGPNLSAKSSATTSLVPTTASSLALSISSSKSVSLSSASAVSASAMSSTNLYGANATTPPSSSATAKPATTNYPSVVSPGSFHAFGCYKDDGSPRPIIVGWAMSSNYLSIESCAQTCPDSPLFGVEWGSQCFCGIMFEKTAIKMDQKLCEGTKCTGKSNEFCGDWGAMFVYSKNSSSDTSSSASSTTLVNVENNSPAVSSLSVSRTNPGSSPTASPSTSTGQGGITSSVSTPLSASSSWTPSSWITSSRPTSPGPGISTLAPSLYSSASPTSVSVKAADAPSVSPALSPLASLQASLTSSSPHPTTLSAPPTGAPLSSTAWVDWLNSLVPGLGSRLCASQGGWSFMRC